MTRPRASTVLRRFLEGESARELALWLASREGWASTLSGAHHDIEAIIRRALKRGRKGKR